MAKETPRIQKAKKTAGMATASLICGIAGIFINLLGIPSLLAIIFGIISLVKISRNPNLKGKGFAIAGIILGVVGIILMIFLIIFVILSYYAGISAVEYA